MANEKHVYVVAQGDYTDTALSAEAWQVGLRFIVAPGGAPAPVGSLGNTFDVVEANISRTEADWNITSNWSFECGVNDLDVGDWLNDQLAPAFGIWLAACGAHTKVRLNEIKVYPILAPLGKVIPAPPYSQGTPATLTWTSDNPVGGFSGSLMPLQTSVVASHRTAQTGRRGRGRMYLPPFGTTAMSSAGSGQGLLSTGAITAAGAAQVDLLEDTQLSGSDPLGIWALPIITGAPWDNYALITQVQIGNAVDTQRRRRFQIDETYVSSPVDNPA